MAINKPVSRGHEEIEFKPIPGSESDWAALSYVERSRLWNYLGVYPVGLMIVLVLLLLGSVAS